MPRNRRDRRHGLKTKSGKLINRRRKNRYYQQLVKTGWMPANATPRKGRHAVRWAAAFERTQQTAIKYIEEDGFKVLAVPGVHGGKATGVYGVITPALLEDDNIRHLLEILEKFELSETVSGEPVGPAYEFAALSMVRAIGYIAGWLKPGNKRWW